MLMQRRRGDSRADPSRRGSISWTADEGNTWHDLDIGGTGYYPRAVQLPDGRIFCVHHRGSDNGYDGSIDQQIEAMTFRLNIGQ